MNENCNKFGNELLFSTFSAINFLYKKKCCETIPTNLSRWDGMIYNTRTGGASKPST
jgi:uncharacterized protein (DUF2237 family)